MHLSVEEQSAVEKRVVVELPADVVAARLEEEYRKLSKNVRMKGFRQGHIPKGLLRKMYAKDATQAVSSNLIRENLMPALDQSGLKPITFPDIEPGELAEGAPFRFTLQFQVKPVFELQGLTTITVERRSMEVDEAKLQQELEELRDQHAELQTVEERGADIGDVVEFDYSVYDTEPTDEAVAMEQNAGRKLELGKPGLVPGFEDNLMGVREGDERSFSLTLPDDQGSPLAGKPAYFKVIVKAVSKKVLPDVDDDWAKDLGHEDLSALRASIYDRLSDQVAREEDDRVKQSLVEQLSAGNAIDVPPALVDASLEKILRVLAMNLAMSGVPEDQIKSLLSSEHATMRVRARELAKRDLLLDAVATHAGIAVTDEHLDAKLEEMATTLRQPKAKVKAQLVREERLEAVRNEVKNDLALAWLEKTATEAASANAG